MTSKLDQKKISKFFGVSAGEIAKKQEKEQDANFEKKRRILIDGFRIPQNINGNDIEPELYSVSETYKHHVSMKKLFDSEKNEDLDGDVKNNLKKGDLKNSDSNTFDAIRNDIKNKITNIKSSSQEEKKHHLFYYIKCSLPKVLFALNSDCEVYVSLYDAKSKTPLTEEYYMEIPQNNIRKEVRQCMFQDLLEKEIDNGIYIVYKVYRIGGLIMDLSGKKKKKDKEVGHNFRRIWGITCTKITRDFVHDGIESGKEVRPQFNGFYGLKDNNDQDYCRVVKRCINMLSSKKEIPKEEQLNELDRELGSITCKIKTYKGDLGVLKDEVEDFLDIVYIPRLTPVMERPEDQHHDLYLTLVKGDFLQGRKKSPKNIQISVSLCGNNRQPIKGCLSRGRGASSPTTIFNSSVLYHCNQPILGERVKISLPEQPSPATCHLYFTVAHCSSSGTSEGEIFSHSWCKLVDEKSNTIKQDGKYKIPCFKYDKKIVKKNPDYLKLPDGVVEKIKTKQMLIFDVRLRSKRISQDPAIHNLLNWSIIQNTEELNKVLVQIGRKSVDVFASNLPTVCESLFEVATQSDSKQIQDCATSVLIRLLANANAKMPERSSSVLTKYLQSEYFTCREIHRNLLAFITNCLEEIMIEEKKDSTHVFEMLNTIFKAIEPVMEIVVASYKKDIVSGIPTVTPKQFKKRLNELFAQMNDLVMSRESRLVVFQSHAIKKIAPLFTRVSDVFSAKELALLASEFLDQITTERTALSILKLLLIQDMLKKKYILQIDWKRRFLPMVVKQVHRHMTRTANERLFCIKILSQVFPVLHTEEKEQETQPSVGLNDRKMLLEIRKLLPTIIKVINDLDGGRYSFAKIHEALPQSKNRLLKDTVVVFLAIIEVTDAISFQELLDYLLTKSKRGEKQFLVSILTLMSKFVEDSVFNRYWIMMRMSELKCGVTLLTWTSATLCKNYLFADTFDEEVWSAYLNVGLGLLVQRDLSIESHSAAKKEFMKDQYGEQRILIAAELEKTWEYLGPKQVKFVELMVHRIVECSQSSVPEVYEMAKNIYFSLLNREFENTGGLSRVEAHTIDSISDVVTRVGKTALDSYRVFFSTDLHEELEESDEEELQKLGAIFLNDVTELFEHLVALDLPTGTKRFEHERTAACLNLIAYLKQAGKQQMYMKYIQYLCKIHEEMENWVEQGKALQGLQAKLGWSDKELPATPWLKVQTEKERKITLIKMAIEAFDKSKYWEESISLCKILEQAYENELYNFEKYRNVLLRRAEYVQKISTVDRMFRNYYRVFFTGSGFEEDSKDKTFIYASFENVREFTNILKEKYPNAVVVNSSSKYPKEIPHLRPSISIEETEEKSKGALDKVRGMSKTRGSISKSSSSYNSRPTYIQITTLFCSGPEEMKGKPNALKENDDIPRRVKKYLTENNVDIFTYTYQSKEHQAEAKKKNPNRPPNQFRDLWLVRVFLVGEDSFPTTRRKVDVSKIVNVVIPPIQTAVSNLTNKNDALKSVIDTTMEAVEKAIEDPNQQDPDAELKIDTGPLSMQLTGVIDAAVSGGVDKYREAFFDGNYIEDYPEQAHLVEEFKDALRQQLEILKDGLQVFEEYCTKDLVPLSQHLQNTYEKMCDSLDELLSGGMKMKSPRLIGSKGKGKNGTIRRKRFMSIKVRSGSTIKKNLFLRKKSSHKNLFKKSSTLERAKKVQNEFFG